MVHDAIVIGGSFAGLSAAMQLARARRQVLVIDSDLPRNRFADAAHGFLGQDGRPPQAILQEARRQLAAYPTVQFVAGRATEARADGSRFAVTLADGDVARAARLVLATGVKDELPPIPGLSERWGASVLHCPYCHGYEVANRPLGVLGDHPLSAHKAAMLTDWGPTTYFSQDAFEPDEAALALLAARGVAIERTPIVALLGKAPDLEAVRLADGRTAPLAALFVAPQVSMTNPLAEQLGCAFEQGPAGPYLRIDPRGLTSVSGVYAAGDAANPLHNATLASAAGVMAGFGAHQSLAFAA